MLRASPSFKENYNFCIIKNKFLDIMYKAHWTQVEIAKNAEINSGLKLNV